MDRRGGTREVVDLVNLEQDRFSHIVPDELKSVVVQQVKDVFLSPGKKIVKTNNFVAFVQKSFAKMRSDKSGTAGDKNSHKN
jgi:hypothetical protein